MEGAIVKLIILLGVGYFKFGLAQNICSDILDLDCDNTMANTVRVNEKLARCINNGSTLPNVNVEFPTVREYQEMLKYPTEYFNRSGSVSDTPRFHSTTSDGAVCQWKYTTDEDDHRVPRSIQQAVCSDETAEYSPDGQSLVYQCRRIFYPINVLKWTCKERRVKWSFTQQVVSFGCGLEQVI